MSFPYESLSLLGGLDYSSGLGVDNTVSVVDIATFKESSKLTVGPNPGKIVAGPDETVYCNYIDRQSLHRWQSFVLSR